MKLTLSLAMLRMIVDLMYLGLWKILNLMSWLRLLGLELWNQRDLMLLRLRSLNNLVRLLDLLVLDLLVLDLLVLDLLVLVLDMLVKLLGELLLVWDNWV